MRKVINNLVKILLISMFVCTSPLLASENKPETLTPSELLKANEFRKKFGFKEQNNMNISGYNEESIEKFGVYLTQEEMSEMSRRDKTIESAIELQETIKSFKENFGGLYYDHLKDNGILRIGIVKNGYEKDIINAVSLFPNSEEFEIFEVKYSLEALEVAQERLNQAIKEKEISGVWTYISIPDNRVVISLENSSQVVFEELKISEAEDMFMIIKDSTISFASRSAYTRPLIAGLQLQFPTGNCTSAFTAILDDLSRALITAAHCGEIGDTVYQGGSSIGTVTRRQIGGEVDALAIPLSGSSVSGGIYGASNIVGWISNDLVGQTVCKSGITTGVTCGILRATGVFGFIDGTTIWMTSNRLVEASADSGDSGAAAYYPNSCCNPPGVFGSGIAGVVHAKATYLGNPAFLYTHFEPTAEQLDIIGIVVGP